MHYTTTTKMMMLMMTPAGHGLVFEKGQQPGVTSTLKYKYSLGNCTVRVGVIARDDPAQHSYSAADGATNISLTVIPFRHLRYFSGNTQYPVFADCKHQAPLFPIAWGYLKCCVQINCVESTFHFLVMLCRGWPLKLNMVFIK